MKVRRRLRWVLVATVAGVTLLLDQLTKWWALSALADGHIVPIVWTLRLALHTNKGAAFSMGSDSELVRFLPLVVLVVVGVVVWRSRMALSRTGALAVGLVVGGALGNIVDRALRTEGGGVLSGAVVDFIDVQWWPVFNVADMGVVIGGLLFAVLAVGDADRDAGEPGAGDGEGDRDERLADADTTTS